MNTESGKLRIGILAGIADLYNRSWPQTQGKLNLFMEETATRLRDFGFEVFCAPAASTPDQFEAVCRQYSGQNADLLLVALALYCPSGAMVEALRKTLLPILLWPVQTMYSLDPQTCSDELIMFNHGVHAVQDLANTLVRSEKSFGVIHGQLEQEDFAENLKIWAQSGKALGAMRRANPVQIGGHFEDMLDLQIGQEKFVQQLGVKPVVVSLDEFSDFMNRANETEIESYVQSYQKRFVIDDEVDLKLLQKTARGHRALDRILEKYESSACGLNFLDLCNDERITDALHVGASEFMSRGGGYGGEGDWVTALLIYALQQVLGVASFSEMFSVGYSNNRLLIKHWGEGNFAMARSRPGLKRSSLNDKHKAEFVICDFEFEPGPACLINLNCNAQGRGQLISIDGTLMEDHLPFVSGPRAVFKPNTPDIRDVLNAYAHYGGSHHLALVPCDCRVFLERVSILSCWSYIHL